jgi:predicted DNA-binding transcriptional regulator YafY
MPLVNSAVLSRTIWRDLQVLQGAGFPIHDERMADGSRSVWRVNDAFRRQLPLKLTLAELAALLMSRDLLTANGAGVLGRAITAAVEKVGSVLSKDALGLIDRMRDTIGVRAVGAKLQAPAAEHVAAIQGALVERRRLRLRYYSMSRGEITDRRVDPYHLGGGFCLVGYCHLRQAVRIFAVERIRECEVLAARFEKPEKFDVEKYLEGAWGMIRGDIVTVKVVFARSLARYIRDRLWHPTQKFRDLDGGRLEMTMRVADTLEVQWWILGFGSDAEVLEPAALRGALRRDAEALAQKLAPRRMPAAPVPHAGGELRRARRDAPKHCMAMRARKTRTTRSRTADPPPEVVAEFEQALDEWAAGLEKALPGHFANQLHAAPRGACHSRPDSKEPSMSEIVVTLMRAMDFAARKHRDQRRKGVAAEPYINHLAEVALLVAQATQGSDHLAVVGAVLHDTIEDTATTKEELAAAFGAKVAALVAEVTDDKSLPKQERKRLQIEKASQKSRRAKLIKIADKTSNLRSIIESPPKDWDSNRRREYFQWATKVVNGCRGNNRWLEAQFDEAYQRGCQILAITEASG